MLFIYIQRKKKRKREKEKHFIRTNQINEEIDGWTWTDMI